MDCRDVEQLIDDWLDAHPAGGEGPVTWHVEHCSECSQRWGGLLEALADRTPIPVPADLADRINAAVEHRFAVLPAVQPAAPMSNRSASRWVRVAWPSSLAAAILLALLLPKWLGPEAPPVKPVLPDRTEEAVLVPIPAGPWVMNAWAESLVASTPLNPAARLARGMAIEAALQSMPDPGPVPVVHEPRELPPLEDRELSTPLQLMPLGVRPLGA